MWSLAGIINKCNAVKYKLNKPINNYDAVAVKRHQGHHPPLNSIILHLLCVRSHLNHARVQATSIKGSRTLKEVPVLDVVNLPSRIQDAYLLWSSRTPIDTHTHAAFNRAIMDRPHATNRGFEYRLSSCGVKQLESGVVHTHTRTHTHAHTTHTHTHTQCVCVCVCACVCVFLAFTTMTVVNVDESQTYKCRNLSIDVCGFEKQCFHRCFTAAASNQ